MEKNDPESFLYLQTGLFVGFKVISDLLDSK